MIHLADLRCAKCGTQYGPDAIWCFAAGSTPDRVLGPDTLPMNAGVPPRALCMDCWPALPRVAAEE
jgi:uncharacterized OB-fold protein